MGRIEPRTALLRSGIAIVIRSAVDADATAILDYRRAQVGTHDFEVNAPDEWDFDESKQIEMIREAADKDNWLYLLAIIAPPSRDAADPARVVGGLLFRGQAKRRMAHHGTFGIGVDAAWRGRGIGRALIEGLLDWAAAHPTLEKVCLNVFATNNAAQSLYRTLGFVEEGRTPRHFRLGMGRYIDDLTMSQYVKAGMAPAGFNTWRCGDRTGTGAAVLERA